MTRGIIIGGGIGGLATAIALARVGVECDVYEQAGQLREVGAGLTLWANAFRALQQLGVADSLLPLGSKVEGFQVRTWSGRVLTQHDYAPLEHKLGVPVNLAALRPDLLRELAARVDPNLLHFNNRFVRLAEESGKVCATFADGKEAHADFLVGADGLHSLIRAHLHNEPKPRYAGYTCWRGVANLSPPAWSNIAFEAWGPGSRFAIQPCGQGRVFWYATRNAREGEPDSPRGRKAALHEVFDRWHEPIPQTINATPDDQILRNDIVDRPPIRQWGRGRITLLGDAAHPTTPNLGQGACQALEDAVVLADSLRATGDIETALRAYEDSRRRRTASITTISLRNGRLTQWEQPLACGFRNLLVRCLPASLFLRSLASVISVDILSLPPADAAPPPRQEDGVVPAASS
jgi:2-polyprenyl-6-methoxyphenol hydroxylase-like FAD-dependent oxidoreductase